MSEDCPHCVFEITEDNCLGCFEGSHYKPKPITNADRIRAMTDEELSSFLDIATVCVCFPCTRDINNLKHFNNCKHENGTCEKEWLEWLKGEAEV